MPEINANANDRISTEPAHIRATVHVDPIQSNMKYIGEIPRLPDWFPRLSSFYTSKPSTFSYLKYLQGDQNSNADDLILEAREYVC